MYYFKTYLFYAVFLVFFLNNELLIKKSVSIVVVYFGIRT